MKYSFLVLLVCLCGCVSARVSDVTTDKDGNVVNDCSATYFSWFKDVDAASIGACGAGGDVAGSHTNDQAMSTLLATALRLPPPQPVEQPQPVNPFDVLKRRSRQ